MKKIANAIAAWFGALRRIVANHDRDLAALRRQIEAAERCIRQRTEIGVEVPIRGPCHVIVVGRYSGSDYVQTFSVPTDDLARIIDMLRAMERFGVVNYVDAPPRVKSVFPFGQRQGKKRG